MTTVTETQNPYSWLNTRNAASSASKQEDQQMRFLTLLTTQLKNQDPMNPMENAEMTSQLAQMSTVDGIERLNSMFQQMLAGQESAEAMQAAALVGRSVLVEGKGMVLTEAGGIGGFEVPQGADKVTLSIVDANGLEVAKLELEDVEPGSHNYFWDGTAIDGAAAAPGLYSVKVSAMLGGQQIDSARTLEFGQVTGVIRGPKSTDLQIGNLGIFQFNDIKQIL
jgi:flagellar basal-body rod modification protein FlgD